MTDITIAQLRYADKVARAHFTYKADGTRPEENTWRSLADEALAGKSWVGDCDDLASTALDILTRTLPDDALDKCFRLEVASPDCPAGVPFDHMIGAVMLPGLNLWIIGDTFGEAYPASRMPHRIVNYSKLSEGTVWKKGTSPR